MTTRILRNVVIGLLVVVALGAILISFVRRGEDERSIRFSDVIAAAADGSLRSVEVRGSRLEVRLAGDPETYQSRMSGDTDIALVLQSTGVSIGGSDENALRLTFKSGGASGAWWDYFLYLLFLGVFLVLLVFFFRAVRALNRAAERLAEVSDRLSGNQSESGSFPYTDSSRAGMTPDDRTMES